MRAYRIVLRFLAAFWLASAVSITAVQAQGNDVVVFAAASLKTALDDISGLWKRGNNHSSLKISYAGSNTLARQIEQGAPAQIFISADLAWMDNLEKGGMIQPKSRVNLLANRIVLIAPMSSSVSIDLANPGALAAALGDGRLAMANVEAVPAGRYGKAALTTLGHWEGIRDRVAQADNVRAALLLVSRGEAPLGIVYATDAAADANVRVVATFPESTHPPILYPAALTRAGSSADAARFLAFLGGAEARAMFARHGFSVLAH